MLRGALKGHFINVEEGLFSIGVLPTKRAENITVQEYLEKGGATIVEFARLKVGEGIEVETKDFAEEVAEQLK